MRRRSMSVMLNCAVAALAVVACGGGDVPLPADTTNFVLEKFTCSGCEIVLDSVAYLGHTDDTVSIAAGSIPVTDARGRFYTTTADESQVLAFDPGGRLITTFGKRGRGPGEFSSIGAIYPASGDSLLVVDRGNMHLMSPDYEYVREVMQGVRSVTAHSSTTLADGRIVVPWRSNTIHIVDRSGGIDTVALQGLDSATCSGCGAPSVREGVTPGTIWLTMENRYRIYLMGLDGSWQKTITRNAEWFPPWKDADEHGAMSNDEFTRSRTILARQTSDGLLWTFVMKPAFDPAKVDMMKLEDDPARAHEMYSQFRTVVEVIDPATYELLTSTEVAGLAFPVGNDLLAQLIAHPGDEFHFKVLRLSMRGR